MRQPEPLSRILERIDSAPWSDLLFWQGGAVTAETPVVVFDADDPEIADDAVGPWIEVAGAVWRPFLGVDDVRSVRANLAAQVENYDAALLYEALRYYFDEDAFLRVDQADLG